MKPHIYCQAVFGRGSGLGNRLFPWARCRIFASVNETPILAPRWVSLRVKPLFRSGTGLWTYPRQVLLAGQFRPGRADIGGLERWRIERHSQIHPEPDNFSSPVADAYGPGRHLVRFEGDRTGLGRFHLLEGRDEFIRTELRAATRDRWLRMADRTAGIPIGIHVRLGDFREGPAETHRNERGEWKGAMRTPLQWYVDGLSLLRELMGSTVPAFVVSDGSPAELGPLLAMEAVTLVRSRSPVSDLWSLANSKLLMASIGSSFSAWASFLGQMPTVVYPLLEAHSFPIRNRYGRFNGFLDPDAPDPLLVESVREVSRPRSRPPG